MGYMGYFISSLHKTEALEIDPPTPPTPETITHTSLATVSAMCTLLGMVMASRFNCSKKFFPAGLVALSSLSMAVAFVTVGL